MFETGAVSLAQANFDLDGLFAIFAGQDFAVAV
jgi:hypothetical protein